MSEAELDTEIAKQLEAVNALKRQRLALLPRCSFCNGTGSTGIPTYLTRCTVCRGSAVDQGALLEARKAWGEM